ncbi:IS30 family transposase [Oscillibacter sp. GMB15532]|uniref:IS30 family transposase n=1 Tax=Oscillibacter sp. GMB15532 TaxID=3230022 RepID=UPI0034DF54D9
MSHYHHLSISEREKILVLRTEGKSVRRIAGEIGRSASTISRELRRNQLHHERYSAIDAQRSYHNRRKKCRRQRLLSNMLLKETVMRLFLKEQWSPEQIANRLVHENNQLRVSYATIYRAIYSGAFDTPEQRRSKGNRGAIRNLRHRGKTRRRQGTVETRGKIAISNRIQERPQEADDRQIIGHWEADTVAGKTGSACLVTITDRCSRYLLAGKVAKRYSALVADKMISLLSALPKKKRRTITPDRGKEFSKHSCVTKALNGVQFYFPAPHAPWQRGTNENTNGLLREYLPKSFDIALSSENQIADFIKKLNHRPRKCLGWKTPFEVFFQKSLHLT